MTNETYGEKVSVNMNSSTLSAIDLLVDNGYYSNRSDFINQAVRSAIERQQTTIDRIIDLNTGRGGRHGTLTLERKGSGSTLVFGAAGSRRGPALRAAVEKHPQQDEPSSDAEDAGGSWFFGVSGYTRREIDELYAAGESFDLTGYGVLVIAEDCDEAKLFEVVRSIDVRGRVKCSESVREHYGLKK